MRTLMAGLSVGPRGPVRIHHFSMVTQAAPKRSEPKVYPAENLAYVNKKWNRSVRGSWAERRWWGVKSAWRQRFERLRYGHTLVEKNES